MMWQTIRELVASGVTIFLTTQQLDEADALADWIAVLDDGNVIAAGSPEELKRGIPGAHVRLRFADTTGLDAAERALGGRLRHEDTVTLAVPSNGDATAVRALLNRLGATADEVEEVSVHTPDLDDVCPHRSPDGRKHYRNGERSMTTLAFAAKDSLLTLGRAEQDSGGIDLVLAQREAVSAWRADDDL